MQALKRMGFKPICIYVKLKIHPTICAVFFKPRSFLRLEASVWWHYAKWSREGELYLLWVVCNSFYKIAHRDRDPFLLFIMEKFKHAKVDKKYNKSPCSLHPDFSGINSDNFIWPRSLPTFPIILFQSPSQTLFNFTHKDFSTCL